MWGVGPAVGKSTNREGNQLFRSVGIPGRVVTIQWGITGGNQSNRSRAREGDPYPGLSNRPTARNCNWSCQGIGVGRVIQHQQK